MILGADVTHPSPILWVWISEAVTPQKDENLRGEGPSIAAVTAYSTCPAWATRCTSSRKRVAKNSSRTGRNSGGQLGKFFATNKVYPTKILMFRDVSEGFFNKVKEEEYEQMKQVCLDYGEVRNSKDQNHLRVVSKEAAPHAFSAMNEKRGVGNKNIPRERSSHQDCHPEREFFLNSHVGIQGTSKPPVSRIHDETLYDGRFAEDYVLLVLRIRSMPQPVSTRGHVLRHLAVYRAAFIEKE
ncbi:protein argonaute-3-like, partial [Folsomia candida]|uniref:protein argonaute-3-like n=1 Tax=Folsomia candida TaxID=158441 RepID=UPI000B8FF9CE